MAEPDRPQSPFAGMADFSARTPVRVLSPDEIDRMLVEHRLYLETEYHEGHRADFSSADLTGRDFSRLDLRGIKMDRAVLRGADFTEPIPSVGEAGAAFGTGGGKRWRTALWLQPCAAAAGGR